MAFLPYVQDIDIIYRLFLASQDNNLLLLEEENTFGGPNTVYWAPGVIVDFVCCHITKILKISSNHASSKQPKLERKLTHT